MPCSRTSRSDRPLYNRHVFEIGTSLREARVRQGLELDDAEAATKIRAKYLRALEDERFELLPAETYVKGFLRAYADYLGLDGQVYLDEFNSRYASEEDEVPAFTRPRRQRAIPDRRTESTLVLAALAGIAAVAALVVLAARWAGDGDDARTRERAATTSVGRQETRERKPASAQVQWFALRIAAVGGDSTVTVRRSLTRQLLFSGTLPRGREISLKGQRLRVTIGTPENVTLRLRGRRVAIPSAGAPAELIATASGIRATSTG